MGCGVCVCGVWGCRCVGCGGGQIKCTSSHAWLTAALFLTVHTSASFLFCHSASISCWIVGFPRKMQDPSGSNCTTYPLINISLVRLFFIPQHVPVQLILLTTYPWYAYYLSHSLFLYYVSPWQHIPGTRMFYPTSCSCSTKYCIIIYCVSKTKYCTITLFRLSTIKFCTITYTLWVKFSAAQLPAVWLQLSTAQLPTTDWVQLSTTQLPTTALVQLNTAQLPTTAWF